jgi:hypothetical protein
VTEGGFAAGVGRDAASTTRLRVKTAAKATTL